MANHPHSQIDSLIIDNLVKTVRFSEMDVYEDTLSSDYDKNAPWIRTKYNPPGPEGSSAYGWAGLTGGKNSMMERVGNKIANVGASSQEIDWINQTFIPQADSSLLYGGLDMIPGMERFDYGGVGNFDLTNPTDTTMYNSIARKLIEDQYKSSLNYPGDNIENFLNMWHFGPDTTKWGTNKDYVDKGTKYYKSLLKP